MSRLVGSDKKKFNRLFLLNFLLIVFLFGLIFSEISSLTDARYLLSESGSVLPFSFYIQLIAYLAMLIFHLMILYGLYKLRLLLFYNFNKKKFEFENPD